ncbi:hypothetical protein [Streptomyces sp. NPDC000880]
MSSAPTLNGQVIGQAHYATRAVLEGRLARTGITFHQVVALNAIADNGGAVERDWPVGRMTGTLKIDESAAGAKIAELTTAGLLEALPAVAGEGARVGFTDEGQVPHGRTAATAEITERLYGDLPADGLGPRVAC